MTTTGTLLAAWCCASGCANSITPPPAPVDPVSIFLLDYGRHSSLVLPGSEGPPLVEYAYGDWRWFAQDESEWYDAFATLLWPTQGALGRRTIDAEPTVAGLRAFAGCEEVLEIAAERDRARALLAELDERFERHAETRHHQPRYDLTFVHADRAFSAFHNCNHAVAGWLRKAGCRVRGSTMFADWVLAPAAVDRS